MLLASDRPHPIAAALGAVLEEIAALGAIVLFIGMIMVWADIVAVPL
ncbi:MAG: hypothetical protein ACOY5F_14390 [Pseudomonadota bacterium]